MNIAIRPSTPQDLQSLTLVNQSATETLRKHYVRMPGVAQRDEAPTTLIVAEIEDGRVVGRCEYRQNGDELYFMSLGVHISYRRRGVLHALFNYLESMAREKSCTTLTCETIEETGNAKIFEKLGMKVEERSISTKYRAPTGTPVYELRMVKTLEKR